MSQSKFAIDNNRTTYDAFHLWLKNI